MPVKSGSLPFKWWAPFFVLPGSAFAWALKTRLQTGQFIRLVIRCVFIGLFPPVVVGVTMFFDMVRYTHTCNNIYNQRLSFDKNNAHTLMYLLRY